MKPIRTAAVLIYQDDKVLLVKHGETSNHPTDSYGLPAGKLEEGEDELDCAVRELKEETGLVAEREDLIITPKIYDAVLERKHDEEKPSTMRTFICHRYTGKLRPTLETIPQWTNLNDLDNYNLVKNVKDAIMDGLQFGENLR